MIHSMMNNPSLVPDRLIEILNKELTGEEQELFCMNFISHLNRNPKIDFAISLDMVYEWIGFSKKSNAKRLLHNLIEGVHNRVFNVADGYDDLFLLQKEHEKTTETPGGSNKEHIMFEPPKGNAHSRVLHHNGWVLLEYVRLVAEETNTALEKQILEAEESHYGVL